MDNKIEELRVESGLGAKKVALDSVVRVTDWILYLKLGVSQWQSRKALKLRRDGWGILDIARELDVDKDIVSKWCREIELTTEQRADLLESEPQWENRQKGV